MNNFTLCTSCSTFHALVEFLFKINRQLLEERKKQNGQQIYFKIKTQHFLTSFLVTLLNMPIRVNKCV